MTSDRPINDESGCPEESLLLSGLEGERKGKDNYLQLRFATSLAGDRDPAQVCRVVESGLFFPRRCALISNDQISQATSPNQNADPWKVRWTLKC